MSFFYQENIEKEIYAKKNKNKGKQVNYMVQKFILGLRDKQYIEALFVKDYCTMNKKVCDIIIDSGSCENIMAKFLVKTLRLTTVKHPHSYKVE